MRKYLKYPYLASLAFIGLLLAECAEEDLDIDGKEATVLVQLFNIDSLEGVKRLQTPNEMLIALLDSAIDTTNRRIIFLRGTDSLPDRADALLLVRDSLVEVKNERDSIKSSLDQIAVAITAGESAIDALSGENAEGTLSFDSARQFLFPLPANDSTAVFYVTVGDQTDTLELVYERNTIERNKSIIVEALNCYVVDHSYDSIKMFCGDDLACSSFASSPRGLCLDSLTCNSDEVTIALYF